MVVNIESAENMKVILGQSDTRSKVKAESIIIANTTNATYNFSLKDGNHTYFIAMPEDQNEDKINSITWSFMLDV